MQSSSVQKSQANFKYILINWADLISIKCKMNWHNWWFGGVFSFYVEIPPANKFKQCCHYSFDSYVCFNSMIKNIYGHNLTLMTKLDFSHIYLFGASSSVNNLLMEVWIYQSISKSKDTLPRQLFNFSLQAPTTAYIINYLLNATNA